MEKTLYLQSENVQLEVKHYGDNDTFTLNFINDIGLETKAAFTREDFEQLGEGINYLLKSKNTERLLNIESEISRSTAELELSRNKITSLEAEVSVLATELELLKNGR